MKKIEKRASIESMLILGIDPGMAETGWGIIESSNFNPSASSIELRTSPLRARFQISNLKTKKPKVDNGLMLVDYGCIKTKVGYPLPERLLVLKKELEKIISKHKPSCLAMEQLFFGRNAKTAMTVGLARGVMMLAAAEENIPIFEYQGLRVKLNLSGDGRCSKSGMQDVVKKILHLQTIPKPQHAADALAIAIYHCLGKKNEPSKK